nr:AAA family ATPase [Rhodanobacter sp. K2T2]
MRQFRAENEDALVTHAPKDAASGAGRQKWARQISSWLYSSDHISIAYSIQYDDVDVEQLSPGTRGILLLLLYLAIDTEDDRPLIIDQPEENLDPQSIYSELVEHFRRAKQRRQIVIVTHNANLVVNTDADQVIVARSEGHVPGCLPRMHYDSGGLENAGIRKQVCDILEGGEIAFKERAKRLRVRLR